MFGRITAISVLVLASAAFAEAPADPVAVVAYKNGMRLLGAANFMNENLTEAKVQFMQAAALDFPHGYYGLACANYRSGDPSKFAEAYGYLDHAAKRGVYEALVLRIAYDWHGFGSSKQDGRDVAYARLAELQVPGTVYPLANGSTGAFAIDSSAHAETILTEVLTSGTCGPKIAVQEILARKTESH